jgi:hypothetical protein
MSPPNKPLEVKAAGRTAQQITVEWTVPDQSNGREIQRWLVRACPAVPGNPYAPCQQVPGPPAGQASSATLRAQIPARVTYVGSQAPVNGAEICAVNGAGTSCADRLALQFGGGIAPAQQRGGPTGIKPAATIGIRTAPGPTSLNPQALTPGAGSAGAPSATRNRPPSGGIAVKRSAPETAGAPAARGGIAAAAAAKSAGSVRMKPPEPIVVAAGALRLKAGAAPAPQPISVGAASLILKASAAPAPKDITVSASTLRLSAKPASTGFGSKALTTSVLTKNVIAVDAAALRIEAASAPPVQPIAVNASALTLKAGAVVPPAPISVNAVSLRLTATGPTSPNR